MKKIITFLLLITVFSINAQNSISGKITDINNNPLHKVEIYAPEINKGTVSKEDGSYTLDNISKNKIKIIINYLGYKSVSKDIEFISRNYTLNVQLEESFYEMDEVIISTPFNKLQSENVMRVDRLSTKTIQKLGAVTLSEGLVTIPGVNQISTGNSIGKPVIRGLSGNRVLVYTQGIRLENQQFGGEHGLGVNDAGISNIEVIKGPASLLYGSDALGGVLYINPERFASENDSETNLNQRYFSNTLGSNTSLGFKKSYNNWKFLARGTFASHSDYKIPTDKRVTNTRFKEKDFKTGIAFTNSKFSSELRYNFNNSKLGLPEGIEEQSTEKEVHEPYQDIDNHILSIQNKIFFENSKLDINIGYTFNDRKEFESHEEHHDEDEHEDEDEEGTEEGHEEPSLKMELKTFTYNLKYQFPKLGDFEILSGVQGMHQTNTNFGEILIPNAKLNDFGVFTTANISWDKSSLQAGLRYDNRSISTESHLVMHEDDSHLFNAIDKTFNSFTTSLGLRTLLSEDFNLRINLATGFRAPNLAELSSNGVHHGTNRFEKGNNDLVNEKNSQIDISLEYKTKHFELFANGFYNHLDNYIFLMPTNEIEDEKIVYTYEQENAKLYGGEFGLHYHPHPIDWLHIKSTFETVIGKRQSGNNLPLIPANSWVNTFRFEFGNNSWLNDGFTSVSLNSTFAQNKVSEFETTSAAYSLLNLSFGGDVTIGNIVFETSISVNNLLNKEYINHLSQLKSDNILNQGRNIVLGVNINI